MAGPDDTAPAPAPAAPTPPAVPPAPTPAAPQAAGPTPLDNLVASLGLSQLLIVGGAALLVLVDLVFGVLIRDYYVADVVWVPAALIVVAFVVNRRGMASLPFRYESVLLGLSLIIIVGGVRDALIGLLSIAQSPTAWNALEIISHLALTAAVVAIAWGAWQLWRGQR